MQHHRPHADRSWFSVAHKSNFPFTKICGNASSFWEYLLIQEYFLNHDVYKILISFTTRWISFPFTLSWCTEIKCEYIHSRKGERMSTVLRFQNNSEKVFSPFCQKWIHLILNEWKRGRLWLVLAPKPLWSIVHPCFNPSTILHFEQSLVSYLKGCVGIHLAPYSLNVRTVCITTIYSKPSL